MRKIFTKIVLAVLVMGTSISSVLALNEKVNLSIPNLDLGYDPYVAGSQKITGIYFSVAAELKSSSTNYSEAFKVVLMLLPKTAQSTDDGIILWSKDVDAGVLPEAGSIDYKMDIDLTTVSGLVSGEYRLYAYPDGYSTTGGAWFPPSEYFSYVAGPAKTKADLQIGSVTYDFDKINGIISNVVVKVKNTGDTDAAASTINFAFTGTLGDESGSADFDGDLDQVIAGSTTNYTMSSLDLNQLFMGNYDPNMIIGLTIKADSKEVISESSETNNEWTKDDISVITGVKLALEDLGIILPNPVSKEYLKSVSENSQIKSIKVYSLKGATSDVSSAGAGMNVIEFTTSKGVVNQKVVIE